MSQGREEQSQLRFPIHVRDENGFGAGRESDERGHLDVIKKKCADRTRKVASQRSDVVCGRYSGRLSRAERFLNEEGERFLPAVQTFFLERRRSAPFALQAMHCAERNAEA